MVKHIKKFSIADIENLTHILGNYVNAYRLLVASAADLYSINIAKKSEVRKG